ncbi:hypothetical protein ACI258_005246, partial [Salmonella enterica subsp. enterica serovar Montevideo]
SQGADAIQIQGNNVTITNGTLNGTSGGSAAGVNLTGGTQFLPDEPVTLSSFFTLTPSDNGHNRIPDRYSGYRSV